MGLTRGRDLQYPYSIEMDRFKGIREEQNNTYSGISDSSHNNVNEDETSLRDLRSNVAGTGVYTIYSSTISMSSIAQQLSGTPRKIQPDHSDPLNNREDDDASLPSYIEAVRDSR